MQLAKNDDRDFREVMEDMRKHYKSQKPGKHLKASLKMVVSNDSDLEQAIGGIQNIAQADSNSFNSTSQSEITDATDGLVSDDGVPEDKKQATFKEKMEAIREAQKEKANETIDNYIDKMVDAGDANPALQDGIAQTADSTLNFFNSTIAAIGDFVGGIISKISEWASKAFKAMVGFFSDVGKKIGGFFSGLFG
jgi:hypothetical protein